LDPKANLHFRVSSDARRLGRRIACRDPKDRISEGRTRFSAFDDETARDMSITPEVVPASVAKARTADANLLARPHDRYRPRPFPLGFAIICCIAASA
jgi:hypothetical protein